MGQVSQPQSQMTMMMDPTSKAPLGKISWPLSKVIQAALVTFHCSINISIRKQQIRKEPEQVSSPIWPTPSQTIVSDVIDWLFYLTGFVLPRGYPNSVTPDYLEYQLRCLPAHITGWISKSLATSSLIHALNVGPVGPSGTVAASAAIKWITKDGIGAFGRFLVSLSIQGKAKRVP